MNGSTLNDTTHRGLEQKSRAIFRRDRLSHELADFAPAEISLFGFGVDREQGHVVRQLNVVDDAKSAALAASRCRISQARLVDIKTKPRYLVARAMVLLKLYYQVENFVQRFGVLTFKPRESLFKDRQSLTKVGIARYFTAYFCQCLSRWSALSGQCLLQASLHVSQNFSLGRLIQISFRNLVCDLGS